MPLQPLKWIKGWRLDKFFAQLFKKDESGQITVEYGVDKTIGAIDAVLKYESTIRLITGAVSDDVKVSAENVIETLKGAKEQLQDVKTLPDISAALQDYEFSKDENVNDYIHDMVSMTALTFNDGQISIAEAIDIIERTLAFIHGKL